jgi:hypothetical protein
VPVRFQGPPGCVNGGYAAGLLAARMAPGPLRVTLRRPVPLDVALRFAPVEDGGLALTDPDGEVLVAAVGAQAPQIGRVPDVDLDQARAAQPDEELLRAHPFPECFGCGPRRDPADAVALQVGRVGGESWATAWTPGAGLPHDGGELAPQTVWAALDCPSSFAAVPAGAPAHVLGRLEAEVRAPLHVGEQLVVSSWPLGHEGRKRWGATAIRGVGGELRAVARATWIALS